MTITAISTSTETETIRETMEMKKTMATKISHYIKVCTKATYPKYLVQSGSV